MMRIPDQKILHQFLNTINFNDKIERHPGSDFPKISVVVPSFNQAQYLERTILSVINQNYPATELIVIDGGSTDHSIEIIRKYEKHIKYWVSEKDRGQSHAINKGFRIATGDYIGWQNSDDIYLPGVFYRLAKAARKTPDADILYSNLIFINDEDRITGELRLCPTDLRMLVSDGIFPHNQSAFYTKRIIDKAGFIDESFRFTMDWDFFLRIFKIPELKSRFIRDYWGGFREQAASKTSTINDIGLKENLLVFEKNGVIGLRNKKTKVICMIKRFAYHFIYFDWLYTIKLIIKRIF